jgi:hypothetical protein
MIVAMRCVLCWWVTRRLNNAFGGPYLPRVWRGFAGALACTSLQPNIMMVIALFLEHVPEKP